MVLTQEASGLYGAVGLSLRLTMQVAQVVERLLKGRRAGLPDLGRKEIAEPRQRASQVKSCWAGQLLGPVIRHIKHVNITVKASIEKGAPQLGQVYRRLLSFL